MLCVFLFCKVHVFPPFLLLSVLKLLVLFACFLVNSDHCKDIQPAGFPQGASQLLPDSTADRSLKASCPFKSFISITQQVQWHTSNKQPEKRKLTGLGWASQAGRQAGGGTRHLQADRPSDQSRHWTHTHAMPYTRSLTHTYSPVWKKWLSLVHLKPDKDLWELWGFCLSSHCGNQSLMLSGLGGSFLRFGFNQLRE